MVPSRLLDSLPQRPPTPPRDTNAEIDVDDVVDGALDILNDSFDIENALKRTSAHQSFVDTPAQSPSSAAEQQPTSSAVKAAAAKKVGFSPWNEYNRAAGDSSCASGKTTPVKLLRPSRELKPRRSILKPFAPSPSPLSTPQSSADHAVLCSAREFDSFSDNMEAVVQQLAASDRHLRLDAYAALLRSLKGERSSSDVETLITHHLERLSDFLLRDLSAINPSTSAPDGTLVTQAVKALCALLQTSCIGDAFYDDFCASVIRRSIAVLEDPGMPKLIITHFIFLLHEQNFSSRIITVERAQRIIDALQFIDERVKGNSICGNRIFVYKRLAEQVPDVMIHRMTDWLEHLFHAMLSSVTDLRIRAIQAGTSIAIALGHSSEASITVDALFKHEGPNSKTYGHYVCERLRDMLERKLVAEDGHASANVDESRSVPQIWRVVILLLRSRRHRVEHWKYLKAWLNVIQGCFNSKDMQTRYQANLAWNAFVYVVMPNDDASTNLLDTLKRPIVPQLTPKGNDKNSRYARKYGLGSYLNLLYYSFRPTASPADKARHWTTFVVEVLGKLAAKGNNDADTACNVLVALFGGFEPRIWTENRIHESPQLMTLYELPVLDPKWIRQNIKIVFDAVWPLLKLSRWSSTAHPVTETPAFKMWTQLMATLQQAGSKEITASQELKETISQLLNLLHSVSTLETELTGIDGSDCIPFELFQNLTLTAIERIGPLYFCSHILRKGSAPNFEVTATSSHAPSKPESLESPLEHLVVWIASHQSDANAFDRSRALIHVCLSQIKGIQAQRTCLGGLASSLKANRQNLRVNIARRLWLDVASLTCESLGPSVSSPIEETPQLLEPGYRAILQVLRSGLYGLYAGTRDDSGPLRQLWVSTAKAIQAELGPGAKTLHLVQPLYRDISSLVQSKDPIILRNCLIYTAFLLKDGYEHESDRNIKRAQKALRGEATTAHRSISPYDLLLDLMPNVIASADNDDLLTRPEALVYLFESLASFMENLPRHLVSKALSKLQACMRKWVESTPRKPKRSLTPAEPDHRELRKAVSCFSSRPSKVLTTHRFAIHTG